MRYEPHPMQRALTIFKREAHSQYPSIKSAHLSEALAAAIGFKTQAALLAANDSQVAFSKASALAFNRRLAELGYPELEPDGCAEMFGAADVVCVVDQTG